MRKLLLFALMGAGIGAMAQDIKNNPGSNHGNKFEQLGTILPTPNEYRTASGAPGSKYWQQRADYDIKCSLDEKKLTLTGSETVTYYNNSPDALTYIWLQLDENEHSSIKNANYQNESTISQNVSTNTLKEMEEAKNHNGFGDKINKLVDVLTGKPLKYTINKTMMRVEMPTSLKPGQKFTFKCDWSYKIPDRINAYPSSRGGYEFFAEDGNYLFTMSQWYPRLCVYSDFQGWQNHQFAGSGEFALTFGNFKVQMTVPSDHIVLSTGEGQNYAQILTAAQQARWQKAQTAKEPIEIATLEEAIKAEKNPASGTKTWIFKADNVRDFAWTSSRKFVWDAMPTYVEGKKIMCMSAYGKEAYELWHKYSTKVVAHTVKCYSKFTIGYPYPVAQSIEASNGMEYPMICFNNGRTDKDGTYTETSKNAMIGVIIHEVGHNFFPMIINSDERQWTWMDEGLNSFVQFLTGELFDNNYVSRRGPAYSMIDYMKLPKNQLEPIMTNSENIIAFGSNAYGKPAAGLNILRETIMGRELFDYAFKEYARRWAFKHPEPADFFRTMEDASGEDLDWFWRGWFYSTDPCDIAIDSVKHAIFDPNATAQVGGGFGGRGGFGTGTGVAKPIVPLFDDISKIRNREDKKVIFQVDADTSLRDFYWRYDRGIEPYDSTVKAALPPAAAPTAPETLTAEEKAKYANTHLYEISFSNKGGLVMPIIVEFKFEDGTNQIERIPAQIWRKNENTVTKVFMTTKKAIGIKLDPMRETSDINEANNVWGNVDAEPSKFAIFKAGAGNRRNPAATTKNPMQIAKEKGGK